MAHPFYRLLFGDTTLTKVFVGELAWETPTQELLSYFQQFGEILEAVTFRDPESARQACVDPNPVIDGRRANCNIASLGRPRPSPPYSGVAAPVPPPPPTVFYPPYGYPTYSSEYVYHQVFEPPSPPIFSRKKGVYNPQIHQARYYHQLYEPSSSSMAPPYYYGYSLQAPRGTFPAPRPQGPSYLYYPTPMEASSSSTLSLR
ncbi:RNA-binding protein 38-like isoform X2 [Hibiscus syriacus]|uniref:RNA-binding protein 38-like isoform X2 n=1 Tax=Hibiscus syriacus TaxID=106335 RepID=A0A6A2YRX3_HIBSY|nr:RNA-binding protein 38-like isoform X2 [Hibiscus syriacus]